MTAPTIHARREWTSVAPASSTRVHWPSIRIVDIHWPGTKGRIARDKASIARALEGWRRFHVTGRGWRDIAYNVAVDLNGDVWVLRGWDVQDGGVANRSDDVTILLIMGDADKMTDPMKRTVLWAMGEFERRKGGALRRTHHGALQSTTCPGPEATAWSRAGFPPPPPITTPIIEEDPMPTPAEIAHAVWQGTLVSRGDEGLVPALQELADAKTISQRNAARLDALEALVAADRGLSADMVRATITEAIDARILGATVVLNTLPPEVTQ